MRLTAGFWRDFQARRDAAIVGRNVAQRRGLAVGDQFSIGDISVHIARIFSSTVPAEENLIYTSLQFLQYACGLDAAGLVTQHEVLLNKDAEPDRVAAEINRVLRAGPVATTTRRKGAFQASTLSDLVDLIGFAAGRMTVPELRAIAARRAEHIVRIDCLRSLCIKDSGHDCWLKEGVQSPALPDFDGGKVRGEEGIPEGMQECRPCRFPPCIGGG